MARKATTFDPAPARDGRRKAAPARSGRKAAPARSGRKAAGGDRAAASTASKS